MFTVSQWWFLAAELNTINSSDPNANMKTILKTQLRKVFAFSNISIYSIKTDILKFRGIDMFFL